jgi:hypothetical protein
VNGRNGRFTIGVVAVAAVLLFAFASAAFADFSYDVIKAPGEGNPLGNNAQTSPVPRGQEAIWFNHDFTVTPYFFDGSLPSTLPVDEASYVKNGGEAHEFAGSLVVSAPGVYSIDATSVVEIASVETTFTGEIGVFGLDKTDPVSTSNAVPVYDVSAAITITATDTLSGAEFIAYKLDGGPYLQAPDEYGVVSATVVAGVGTHTLTWVAYDNAGNTDQHMASFTVLPAGYVPMLSKPAVKKLSASRFSFKGTVTPAATAKTVTVVVQRKSKGVYRPYRTFTVPVAAYAGSYSLNGSVGRHATYRAKATQGSGSGGWTGFKSK